MLNEIEQAAKADQRHFEGFVQFGVAGEVTLKRFVNEKLSKNSKFVKNLDLLESIVSVWLSRGLSPLYIKS